MGGLTSTSIHLQEAINYALMNKDKENYPVLIHIQWKDKDRMFAFRLNKKEYSAMAQEKEVLICDGKRVKIAEVIKNYIVTGKDNKTYKITKIVLDNDNML